MALTKPWHAYTHSLVFSVGAAIPPVSVVCLSTPRSILEDDDRARMSSADGTHSVQPRAICALAASSEADCARK